MSDKTKIFDIETILTQYFQGIMTKHDIMNCKLPFQIALSEHGFMYDFNDAFRDYNHDDYLRWCMNSDNSTDKAPIIKGLIRNINHFLEGKITEEDFIHWSSMMNTPFTSNFSSRFENSNIDYLCTFFLPRNYKLLAKEQYEALLPLIIDSPNIDVGEFRLRLFRLMQKERKSMYYFFKQYIEGSKSEEDLNAYLSKRFDINIHYFPFLSKLNQLKKENGTVETFLDFCFNDV